MGRMIEIVAIAWCGCWGLAQTDACDPVVLQYPPDGAVSYRVLQDFFWSRMGPEVAYDFKIDRWNPDLSTYEPFLRYDGLAESERLTQNLQLPENRFHPPWFFDRLSQVQVGGETVVRAPVLDPSASYRWSVRVSGQGEECWVSRTLDLVMDPFHRVGVNTHLTTPEEWWPDLGYAAPSESEIAAFTDDLQTLSVPYLFEGMLQAWGREMFRVADRPPYWEPDRFLAGLTGGAPVVISQNMFQPYRVRTSVGIPQAPILGVDFFTMFEPEGDDAVYLNPSNFSVLPEYLFSRHDPRTRPVYLFDVFHVGTPLNWHDLFAYWEDIYCAYHAWRVDPDDPIKRQAILDAMAVYEDDAGFFLFAPHTDIQDLFTAYVQDHVARFRDAVSVWHFGNEPNGGWHIDPRLYAHQLAVFSEAVRSVDPDARVMAATIFPGNPAAVNGEIFHEGMPDFWWIDQFVDELIQMWLQGSISSVPFDVAGINFYFIREDAAARDGSDGLGRIIHWDAPGDRSCPADHTPCPELEAQECQFELFTEFYVTWRNALDYLTDTIGVTHPIPIIIKETASFSESQAIIEAHIPRGISFMHELGHVEDTWAGAQRTAGRVRSTGKRLRDDPAAGRIEAVLWFHYHLSQNTYLVDQAAFPQAVVHTPLWDAIDRLNFPCAPRSADAGPDQKAFCGVGVGIGAPAVAQQQYAWTPTQGLSDPNQAQPWATPMATTTYTVTQTNGCFEAVQDAVTVVVVPPLEPAFFPLWRSQTGLTPEMDVDDSGRIDVPDFVGYVTSWAGCPR